MSHDKKYLPILCIVVFLFVVLFLLYLKQTRVTNNQNLFPSPTPSPALFLKKPSEGRVCTADVQHCPNGSYVGRVAPYCTFAPCPPLSR